MVTMDEALAYLGIDYPDDTINLNLARALATATKTLEGAVGHDVVALMPKDPRVVELILIYVDDLYSNRGVSAKVSGATRKLVHTMELQLKMELRALRKEAGA